MKEIALHIMDIVQNSITANAGFISVCVFINKEKDDLTVEISDNGKGMDADMLSRVTSPFTTTRTTRKVGLGIPLFKAGAEAAGGSFVINSQPGRGTQVRAVYGLSHIDRPPVGDIASVIHTLIVCNPEIDFSFEAEYGDKTFALNTAEIKKTLDGVPVTQSDVSVWLIEYLKEGIDEIFGGNFE